MERIGKKYELTYTANNGGSWNPAPYYYNSLRAAIAAGKEIVRGEHSPQRGNKSFIRVFDTLTGKFAYQGLLWDRRERFVNLTEED